MTNVYKLNSNPPQMMPAQGTSQPAGTAAAGAMQDIYDAMALVMQFEAKMVEANGKQSQNLSQMGMSQAQMQEGEYNQIEDSIKQQNEQSHESFWDKLEDVGKLLFDVVKLVGEAGEYLFTGNTSDLKSTLSSIEQNPELSTVIKALEYIASAAIVIVALASGNIELAVVAIALLVLSQTGALGDMTNAVSQFLQDHGMSSGEAKLAADIFTIVVTTVATLGVGALASAGTTAFAALADSIGSSADEAAEEAVDEVGEEATDEVEPPKEEPEPEKTSLLQRVWATVKAYAPQAVMGFSAGTASTNIGVDIINETNMSSEEKKKWGTYLQAAVEIAAAVAAIAAGVAGASAGEGASSLGESLQKILPDSASNYLSSLANYGEQAQSLAKIVQGGSQVVAGGLDVPLALNQLKQGELQKVISEAEGILTLLDSGMNLDASYMQSNSKNLDAILKTFGDIANDFNMTAPYQAAIQSMIQS